jgi:hypothetical protein
MTATVHNDLKAHAASIQTSFQEIVCALRESLGAGMLADIAKADVRSVNRWAAGTSTPRTEAETRIRTTFQIVALLQEVEADSTIRAWFHGMNPLLNDSSPVELLLENHLKEVLSAARNFVANG